MATQSSTIKAIDAIRTTRSMRRLKPDPIPDEVLREIIDAAVRAPSGSNQQTWSFVIVTDQKLKLDIQKIYAGVAARYFETGPTDVQGVDEPQVMSRVRSSARHLAEHLHESPVLVFACISGDRSFPLGASIYPAVQNLMLAARAYGIGSTLTTFHLAREQEVKHLLGIPEDVHTAALIPLGYPIGRWGVGKRKPIEKISFHNHFGTRYWES